MEQVSRLPGLGGLVSGHQRISGHTTFPANFRVRLGIELIPTCPKGLTRVPENQV